MGLVWRLKGGGGGAGKGGGGLQNGQMEKWGDIEGDFVRLFLLEHVFPFSTCLQSSHFCSISDFSNLLSLYKFILEMDKG